MNHCVYWRIFYSTVVHGISTDSKIRELVLKIMAAIKQYLKWWINLIVKLHVSKNYFFQQDRSAYQTAKSTKKLFGEHSVNIFSWPSNCIETVRHKIKQWETTHNGHYRSQMEQIWNVFNPETCISLVESMPNRIRAIILTSIIDIKICTLFLVY